MSRAEKVFVLYESRAFLTNSDEAIVLAVASNEDEARRLGETEYADTDGIWFEQTVVNDEVVKEEERVELPPGSLRYRGDEPQATQ